MGGALSDASFTTVSSQCPGHSAMGTNPWLAGYHFSNSGSSSSILVEELTNRELANFLNPMSYDFNDKFDSFTMLQNTSGVQNSTKLSVISPVHRRLRPRTPNSTVMAWGACNYRVHNCALHKLIPWSKYVQYFVQFTVCK